jgi:anti-sigma regulatory factor (Ser/Thr protein kinase)
MPHRVEVAVRAVRADAVAAFPGLPVAVRSARRFVRACLRGPRADDLELVACELITNSIRHTPAGDGGEFIVRVRTGRGWARVEVSDPGPARWTPSEEAGPDDEYGRGMVIVAALADKFGRDATADGQTCWAEMYWTDGRGYGCGQLLAGQRPPDLEELLGEVSSRPQFPLPVPACAQARGLTAGSEV